MNDHDDAGRRVAPDEWPTEPERRYAAVQARLAERYGFGVDSRTVETESAGRVHYLLAGDPDGEPVLLLHGVSTTAATWLPLVPALADEYRLVIPDRPGRGLSAAPSYRGRDLRQFLVAYLLELCEALGIERPHVVANSLGGQQAFLLALDHDRVDRLCLVGAPAGLSTEFPLLVRLMTVRGVNRLLYWLAERGDPLERAHGTAERVLVTDASAISDPFYELLAASDELPGRTESLRSLTTEQGSWGRMGPLFDLREAVVTIDRPTGFVWGSDDWFWPPEVGRPVAERMADAEFHELADHGHMPWLEPDESASGLVGSFLDG